ncbi:hypothetical protein GCM10027168_50340 [Streptomyces capparidis]
MTTYTGPATVVTGDGTHIPVTAELHSGADEDLTDWGGTLAPAPGTSPLPLFSASRGTLRLPDGSEAGFITTNTSATATRHGPDTALDILGEGAAPF